MAAVPARPAALDPEHRFTLTDEDRAALLRFMYLMRFAEERSIALYRQGKVTGSFSDGPVRAFQLRRDPRIAMTWFGEGSTANGQWHEAMNLAGVARLPVVFILENNQFAYSTPNELEFAIDPVERVPGDGFPGTSVDGNDVEAVFEVAHAAAERARGGAGPTLIECQTMRMHGHGAHDDMSYVPEGMLEEWEKRDPIERYAGRLAAG